MMNDWPFADPPNVAVIAHRDIFRKQEWIAYVTHDAGDGCWQFHISGTTAPTEADALVVGLQEIVDMDPSTRELADLPMGWHAGRESPASPWKRSPRDEQP